MKTLLWAPVFADDTSNLEVNFSYLTKQKGNDTLLFRDGAPGGTPITHLTSDAGGNVSGAGDHY